MYAQHRIVHGKSTFEAGDDVSNVIKGAELDRLVTLKAVADTPPASVAQAAAAVSAQTSAGAERKTQVAMTMAGMLASDPSKADEKAWLTDGRPDVDTLNARLPEGVDSVTAAERDAIWAELQPAAQ